VLDQNYSSINNWVIIIIIIIIIIAYYNINEIFGDICELIHVLKILFLSRGDVVITLVLLEMNGTLLCVLPEMALYDKMAKQYSCRCILNRCAPYKYE